MKGRGALLAGVALALAVPIVPDGARASGAWTTLLKPYVYNDLLVEGDTIWCATGGAREEPAGLLCYRRSTSTFTSITREPGGIASNRLTRLHIDSAGRLWVGTQGAGASVLSADRRSWSVVNEFDGMPSDTVNCFEADGDSIWIGTPAGLALWNGIEIAGVLPPLFGTSPFASDDITGLKRRGGDLWVATRIGVYRSALSSGLTVWDTVDAGLGTREVTALADDGTTLIVLDSLRTYRLAAGGDGWEPLANIGSVHRLTDDRGTIIAASNFGMYRWTGTAWFRFNTALTSQPFERTQFAVTIDERSRVWAANVTGLYEEPAGAGAYTLRVPSAPPGNNILGVTPQGNRLWVTSRNEGIGRHDGTTWRHWYPSSTRNEADTTFRNPVFPFALLADPSGPVWTATWDNALERIDDSSFPFHFDHLFPPPLTCGPDPTAPECRDTTASHTFAWVSAADSSGGVWFGMHSPRSDVLPPIGLDYYDANGVFSGNFNPVNQGLAGSRIHALSVDPTGRVWVGYTGEGIDTFDGPPVNGELPNLRHLPATDGLIVEGIAAGREDVWVFTTSELRRYSQGGTFEGSYTVPGPPSDLSQRPVAIALDGTVWLGTSNGIRLYRPTGGIEDYTIANSPLADDDVRSIVVDPATGVVWIGTAGGISRFDPNYVPPPPAPLPALEVAIYPNPARLTNLGPPLRLSGNASEYQGRVYDLTGRLLRVFSVRANDTRFWDGRDAGGELVLPGVYFVRVEAGGRSAVLRVALLR